jgi:hypothetical protein|tara:strand:+ start:403 stop:594 length:192 start_codon:yes stop_codon:yes gene_type:complete
MNEELPIELECFLLKFGMLDEDHRPHKAPDIVHPPKESDHVRAVRTGIGMGWTPSFDGEQPPF